MSLAVLLLAPGAARALERAILQLRVNQVDRGDVLVLLRPGDILVRAADLEQAGLRGFTGRQETVGDARYVSLASLAPGVIFELDEVELALNLTAQTALLAPTVVDIGAGRPPGLVYRQEASAFLNYAVDWLDFDTFTVFGEAGLSLWGALLQSSASRDEDGAVVRGLTSLTVDDRARLNRWVVGDHVARSDSLGGTLLMGGISLSRDFGIDPYFLSFPRLALSGAASTPSTVEVFVNGRLLRRERLSPGAFELKNLQVPTGSGTALMVIRDAFGREQQITSPFYFTTALLTPGLHDYAYTVGFRRDGLGTESWDYRRPGFLGRHRVGLTDDLTAGLRLEAATDLASGGPSLSARLPLGEVELTAAGSQAGNRPGAAGIVAYRYSGRPVSLGATVVGFTDHYATLSLRARDDRPRLETSAFLGTRLTRRADLTLQYSRADFRDRGVQERASAFLSIQLGSRVSLLLTGGRTSERGRPTVTEGGVLLSVFLGERTTATASFDTRRHGDDSGTIEVQRALPVGAGFGYRARAGMTGGQEQGSATLQYQGPYGRYEADYARANGRDTTRLTAAGGLVALGGTVFATRPVSDSFALVRVPGVEGVRGYVNNQEIGRTNARGDLPVPALLSYHGNRIRIADEDIPLDFVVGQQEQTVATPLRGGAVVSFPTQRLRAIVGRVVLLIGGQTIIPTYGELTVTAGGQAFGSPIGRDGEFYLEGVPAGRHPARVEHAGTPCLFMLDVSPEPGRIVDVGIARCTAQDAQER